ncbi:MAG: AAA family ATPase [Candidatus Zixiibacteriota bacterium]|nr:MAG: AAA family ATPase [candidate division Zixibacteria bacterium]
MYIERISLKNFRNLGNQNIGPFSENINLVIGRNGSGKTNILEALGLSAIAKSCRGARTGEMVRFGSESAVVETEGIFQKKKPI